VKDAVRSEVTETVRLTVLEPVVLAIVKVTV